MSNEAVRAGPIQDREDCCFIHSQNTITCESDAATIRGIDANRDPLYLFGCHLEWKFRRNLQAYEELIAALDDPDELIRGLAENLLHRISPRPTHHFETIGDW